MGVLKGRRIVKIGGGGPVNPDKTITITATLQDGFVNPVAEFAPIKHNKKSVVLMVKDDGAVEDYTIGYAYLNGGIQAVDGTTYPGVFYTDGCGRQIPYKMTFAINSNKSREEGSSWNEYFTSWAQYIEMLGNGFEISNHSWEHSGYDKLTQVMQNEYNVYDFTGFRMRTFVVPTNDEGYANTAPNLNYMTVASSFGSPARDDFEGANDSQGIKGVYWADGLLLNTQTFNRFGTLMSRGFTANWEANDVTYLKSLVDQSISKSANGPAYTAHWFSHQLTESNGGFAAFKDLVQYVKNHPGNNDSIWVSGMQEFMEYFEVKAESVMTQTLEGNVLTIKLDMSNISDRNRLKDATILIKNATVTSISYENADSITYNLATGLVNVYKKTAQSNPHNDILPAQIVSVTRQGNNAIVTYNKPVTQTVFSNDRGKAYAVSGNTVIGVSGSGITWTVACQNPVSVGATLDYRMQRGNATDGNGLKVCTYIGHPIA